MSKKFSKKWDREEEEKGNKIAFIDLMITAILEHEKKLSMLIDRLENRVDEIKEIKK